MVRSVAFSFSKLTSSNVLFLYVLLGLLAFECSYTELLLDATFRRVFWMATLAGMLTVASIIYMGRMPVS